MVIRESYPINNPSITVQCHRKTYIEDKLNSSTVLNIDTSWCHSLKDTPPVILSF